MAPSIDIEVNGETRRVRSGATVHEVLKELGVSGRFAVEINREILPRDQFRRCLEPGDRLEVVTFVGGG